MSSLSFISSVNIYWVSPIHRFPRWCSGKKHLPANAGDAGDTSSIPGMGRSSGGGNGNPLWYSCLENLKDREAWWLQSTDSQKVWCDLAIEHACTLYTEKVVSLQRALHHHSNCYEVSTSLSWLQDFPVHSDSRAILLERPDGDTLSLYTLMPPGLMQKKTWSWGSLSRFWPIDMFHPHMCSLKCG